MKVWLNVYCCYEYTFVLVTQANAVSSRKAEQESGKKKKKRKQQWKAAYQQQKEEKSIEELIIKGTNWGQQAHPLISLHQQSNQQIKVQIMKTLRLQY